MTLTSSITLVYLINLIDQSISGEGRAPGGNTEHMGTEFGVVSESDTRSVMRTIVIFYSNEE